MADIYCQIDSEGVGVVGTSKGAEIALNMAVLMPEDISAVVAVSASMGTVLTTFKYNNQTLLPAFPFRLEKAGVSL